MINDLKDANWLFISQAYNIPQIISETMNQLKEDNSPLYYE